MEHNIPELVAQLTLEEKAGLCSGADFWHTKTVERLGIPTLMVSDGPHGLRTQDPERDDPNHSRKAVCFPAGCGHRAGSPRVRRWRCAGACHKHQAQPAVRPQL